MPGKTTSLAIRIVSDGRQAADGFKQAEDRVGGFQRNLDRASVAAGGVAAAIAVAGREAYQAASNLQQSGGAVESVFGAQAAAVEDYAKRAATAVGISRNSYQELASIMGSQLKNMGVSTSELAPKVNDLITLGADLSATYGGTTAEAVQALSSLLRGETDPIERYGVSIKQSDINAQLAAMGLDKLTGSAAKQAQAQAVLTLLSNQTGAALGAFGRESDTAAHAQQVATAQWEDAKATLGEALLPALTAVNGTLAEFAQWAGDNAGTVQALALVVGGLALAVLTIEGAMRLYRAAVLVVTAAQWLWNAAMDANPIGLAVIAIAAIVALIVWATDKLGGLGNMFKLVGEVFKTVGGWIVDHVFQPIMDAINWVLDHLSWIGDAFSAVAGIFSAPAPARGGGGGAVAAPMRGAALGAAPMRGAPLAAIGNASGGPSRAVERGDTYRITVQGAVDPQGTAATIESLLDRRAKAQGRRATLTAGRGAY